MQKYKYFRNFVNSQIRTAKKKCYEKLLNENKNNLKQTWNVINKVLSRTEKRSKFEIKLFINDNRIYTDTFEVPKLCNKFFSSVSSRIHESISLHHYLKMSSQTTFVMFM